jgi:hypothetical protein
MKMMIVLNSAILKNALKEKVHLAMSALIQTHKNQEETLQARCRQRSRLVFRSS